MAISKAMRVALHTISLSNENIEISKTYKIARAIKTLNSPLSPIYKLFDKNIWCNGRNVRVRLYKPKKQLREHLLLFLHGGGWVLENIDTYNNVCKNLAKYTGCPVISVEYSLAPEHVFPAGLEDCYAATQAIFKNTCDFDVNCSKITLIGDSAGGNLSAAVSLLARERGDFKVENQILLYPATYNDHTQNSIFNSVRENGYDYILTAKLVDDYMKLYIGENKENWNSPYFAPLLAKDFSNQPRTMIITAQYDPLRDEGEAYANALAMAGNKVILHRIPNVLHGYFSLSARFKAVKYTFNIINSFLDSENNHGEKFEKTIKLVSFG